MPPAPPQTAGGRGGEEVARRLRIVAATGGRCAVVGGPCSTLLRVSLAWHNTPETAGWDLPIVIRDIDDWLAGNPGRERDREPF